MSASALLWHARAGVEKLGPYGVAGIALLVFAAVVRLSALGPIEARVAQARSQSERMQARDRLAGNPAANLRGAPRDELETFYEFFPAIGALPDRMLKVVEAAERYGLALHTGDYRMVEHKGSRLSRYRILLPVKGSYEQLRGFVSAVLRDVPSAAVEEIALERQSVSEGTLDARLTMSVFVRLENW